MDAIQTIITNAARGGMTDYAENLCHLHGLPLPKVLADARAEEEALRARQEQADESETQGYDNGLDAADQTNDLIFDRHLRALQKVEATIIEALQARLGLQLSGRAQTNLVDKVDEALLALRMVIDELATSTDLRDQLRSE